MTFELEIRDINRVRGHAITFNNLLMSSWPSISLITIKRFRLMSLANIQT